MPKTVYLAGRLDAGEVSIDRFAAELEAAGHTVFEPWWRLGRLPKPYLDYPDAVAPAAWRMVEAARTCDVFILVADDNILGAAVELGAALASYHQRRDKLIYLIGTGKVRQSAFYAHPGITRRLDMLADVRREPWFEQAANARR